MPIPLPPETVILERMRDIAIAANIHTVLGYGDPFVVRHYRHRNTLKEEKPGIALNLIQTEIDNERGQMHTHSEQCWAMTVRVVVDLSLLPEQPVGTAAGDSNDVTGWDRLLAAARLVAGEYVKMGSDLRNLVDDVLYGDIDPDEDSQPDEGRLAIDVIVLYRTYIEDPMLLLGPETNA